MLSFLYTFSNLNIFTSSLCFFVLRPSCSLWLLLKNVADSCSSLSILSKRNLKQNTVPRFSFEMNFMSPWNFFTIIRLMTSPKPIPLTLFPSRTDPNNLNILPWFSCLIPTPLSLTYIMIDGSSVMVVIISIFPPYWVNFKAFEYKFKRTY